jgi:hypothetical protein
MGCIMHDQPYKSTSRFIMYGKSYSKDKKKKQAQLLLFIFPDEMQKVRALLFFRVKDIKTSYIQNY